MLSIKYSDKMETEIKSSLEVSKASITKEIIQKCRICLQHGEISIFSNTNPLDFPLSHYLKLICNIDVKTDDKFPQHLCKNCSKALDSAIQLRKMAIKTQLQLKVLCLHKFNVKNHFDGLEYAQKLVRTKQKEIKIELKATKSDNEIPPQLSLDKDVNSDFIDADPIDNNYESPIQSLIQNETKEIEQNTNNSNSIPINITKLNTDDIPIEKYYKKVLTPENRPKYQCTICKKFYKKGSMSDHILTHLPDSISKYVCEVCGKTFKKFCVFYQHKVVHRSTLPFECKVCPYKGRSKTLLQVHIKRVHKKEYKYQCTLCARKFLDTNNLRYHLRRHEEPKFQCNTCHKSFYENGLLKKHIQSQHMDTVPHKCDVCGNFYKNRKNLLVHQIKVHKRKQVYNNRATYLKLDQVQCNEIKT